MNFAAILVWLNMRMSIWILIKSEPKSADGSS